MDSPVSILSGGKFNENWRVQTAYRSSNIRRARPACKPSACDGCRAENGSCSPTEAAPARASTPNTCSCYPVLPATVETLVKDRDRGPPTLRGITFRLPYIFLSTFLQPPFLLPFPDNLSYRIITNVYVNFRVLRTTCQVSEESQRFAYILLSYILKGKKKRNISRDVTRSYILLRDANREKEDANNRRKLRTVSAPSLEPSSLSLSQMTFTSPARCVSALGHVLEYQRPTSRHRAGIAFHRVGAGRVKD